MGGTTAKASLVENGVVTVSSDYHVQRTDRFAGYPIKLPVVDIVEIGAGGGSIAWFDPAGALKVGPRSAGAEPGPACYRRGGTRV
jgi:N-methylhydantoinase A